MADQARQRAASGSPACWAGGHSRACRSSVDHMPSFEDDGQAANYTEHAGEVDGKVSQLWYHGRGAAGGVGGDHQAEGRGLGHRVGEAAEVGGDKELSPARLHHRLGTEGGEAFLGRLRADHVDEAAPDQKKEGDPHRYPAQAGKGYPVGHLHHPVAGDVQLAAEFGDLIELSGQVAVEGVAVDDKGGEPEGGPAVSVAGQPEERQREKGQSDPCHGDQVGDVNHRAAPDQTSRLPTRCALASMNSRLGPTASPIKRSKMWSASEASSTVTFFSVLVSGFMVVSQSCSGIISPSPLKRWMTAFSPSSARTASSLCSL